VNAQTDQQLLRDYAGSRSEAAFAELVRRHVDLVYSAALRMVCDSHQAEDVAQSVFVTLAQNARQLTQHPVLSGWLHRTAQNLAANAVRTNVRRQTREQEAAAMNELLSAGSDVSWEHIAPHLDTALGELSEPDRDAVLLRYFEKKSAQEMAERLGISDEAAQKRVSRAVERLREFFAKRGVTVGASGLVLVISANAVQAAPVGLAVTISTAAALAGMAVATTATATATKAIAMTTLQKALVAVAVVAASVTTPLVIQNQAKVTLREENQALRLQMGAMTSLQAENDRLSNLLAQANSSQARPDYELLRLRGEVGLLRRQTNEMGKLLNQKPSKNMATTSMPVRLEAVEEDAFSKALLVKARDEIQSSLSRRPAKNKSELIANFTSGFKDSKLFKINGFSEAPGYERVTLFLYFDQIQELRGIVIDRLAGEWRISGETPALRETTHSSTSP